MTQRPGQSGLTLLEILVATVLVAAITIALAGWLRSTGRAVALLQAISSTERNASAARRLLRADLLGRISSYQIDPTKQELRITTRNPLPGQVPVVRLVTWRCGGTTWERHDESANGTANIRSFIGVPAVQFEIDPTGCLWLQPATATTGASSTALAGTDPNSTKQAAQNAWLLVADWP